MKVIIDTNVIIDALQSRKGFLEDAGWVLLKASDYDGYIVASSVTDIFYIHNRFLHDKDRTRKCLIDLFKVFDVLDTTREDCRNALRSDIPDFEDAVLVEAAMREGIEAIVTRNQKDFEKSPVKIYSPEEFLKELSSQKRSAD